ncbi:MAG: FhaA domain-containing protein [Acidimicrobiia bacterium]|jgi:hypothetical protein
MSIARRLERRLEGLLDGMVGLVARGPLQPVEFASRLVREADLASTETEAGPAVPNRFFVAVNPDDLPAEMPVGDYTAAVAEVVAGSIAERGWRTEGPVRVELRGDESVARGSLACRSEVSPGVLTPWARLLGTGVFEVGHNRAIVGRSDACDVVIPDPRVSRRHAVVWRRDGHARIRDLGSSNGTAVDGLAVGPDPVDLEDGSVLSLGGVAFRFEEI